VTATLPSIERMTPPEELPYGPRLTRVLWPVHRGFGAVNRWLVLPAIHAGLGPFFSTPLTGSMLVLRTTGRTSGLRREAPLGYVILDGAVYVCAGFGHRTAWYRNLIADRHVEVVLPSLAFAGVAETVTDRAEWDRVFPAYIRALGIVGRMTLGDVGTAGAARRDAIRSSLPLIRIRPTGLAPGPADPGGGIWVVVQMGWLIVLVRLLMGVGRRRRGGRSPSPET
jgi:deazaflavin-dependent oxidoreductase (nitroreductase family)